MKRFVLPFIVGSLFAMGVSAMGEAALTGTSRVSRAPEFVELSFEVLSECYDSPSGATQANKEQVIKLQNLLGNHVRSDNAVDKVLTNGGYSSRHTKTIYDEETNKRIVICANKFKKSTTVTFKTGNVAEFSVMFDEIQEAVNEAFVVGETVATTFVSMAEPSPGVCAETRKDMRNQAIDLAVADAKEKFAIAAKRCNINLKDSDLIWMSDREEAHHSNKSASYERAPAMNDGGSVVTINFDEISEYGTMTLKYTFPKAQYCEI